MKRNITKKTARKTVVAAQKNENNKNRKVFRTGIKVGLDGALF